MCTRTRHILALLTLTIISLVLRTNSLNHGSSFHPDERHIVMTLERMLSTHSLNPDFFAYGSLPFYLGLFSSKTLSFFLPWVTSYDGLFFLGRSISVVFGVLTVLLTYGLSFSIFRKQSIAILSASLLSFNVLHIQLSRFFAFDGILTALATLVLLSAVYISRRRFILGLPLAGVCLGLALATKISALSLLAPITVGLVLAHPFSLRGISRGLAQIIFIFLLALFVFAITEPYAFIDWSKFVKQNLEQIRMTQGKWRPPYTIQYWNTAPFLYPLEQMARWSFWWPAFIAIMIGLVALFRDKNNQQLRERWILFTWVAVSFISIAGLQVKFPRYLLPIYPTLCIIAALGIYWIASFLNRARWRPVSATLLSFVGAMILIPSAIFAWSFHQIYDSPHSYQSASRWIYRNVPAGATIVGFHWDDKIPLTLPGLEPRAFNYTVDTYELPIYELPDSVIKIRSLTDVLERADYLAWPTQRIPGSLPRAPSEFPRSLHLLRMLFDGELGFKLVHTEKVRPTFFGFEWRSDTLDESFSVYDHPKVMIFKKIEPLPSEEMINRIEASSVTDPATIARERLLEPEFNRASPSANGNSLSEAFSLALWLAIIQILAFLSWPILALSLPRAFDRGYALSKAFGVLVFGYLTWYLALFDAVLLSQSGALLVLLLMALIAATTLSAQRGLYYQLKDIFRRDFFAIEGLFFAVTLALMVMRAFQPEIFWGEKPMDFGLLNYFLRLEQLPAQDPWAAGHQLQYYYMGLFIFAQLIKLAGISAGIGFNLSLVLIGTLSVIGAYAILRIFTRQSFIALVGSLIFYFAGNIEVIRLWLEDRIHSFDLFWASSRVLKSPNFAEYPLWSFLFGDLHAHVIAYPFTLLLIGYGAHLFLEWFQDERNLQLPSAALYGLLLAALFPLNTWDLISYSLFSLVIFSSALYPNEKHISWLSLRERFTLLIKRAGVAVAAMGVIVIPFSKEATAKVPLHWGIVYREEFNTLTQLLLFHGHWYLLTVIASLALLGIFATTRIRHYSRPRLLISIAYVAIPMLLMIFTVGLYRFLEKGPPGDGIPWPALSLSVVVILCATIPTIFPLRKPTQILCFIFAFSAGLVLIASESLFLFDRMNTIFKFYSALGTLLALASLSMAALAFTEFAALARKHLASWILVSLLGVVATLLAVIIFFAGGLDVYFMTTYKRLNTVVRPTLDGTAYLSHYAPEEALLYQWINHNITGTPVLLEAQGISYAQFNRVQMNTGLRVVAGWDHHVKQRGLAALDLQKRQSAIREIYSTLDSSRSLDLLQEYAVDYIVVGKLERETYPNAGLTKFSDKTSGFYRLFIEGETELFVTPFSPNHPKYGAGLHSSVSLMP